VVYESCLGEWTKDRFSLHTHKRSGTNMKPTHTDVHDRNIRIVSMRQPWWHAISKLGKNVENRTTPAKWLNGKTGWIVILESKGKPPPKEVALMCRQSGIAPTPPQVRSLHKRGQEIVGMMRIKSHNKGNLPSHICDSPWYMGHHAWEILDVFPFKQSIRGPHDEPIKGSQCTARRLHNILHHDLIVERILDEII